MGRWPKSTKAQVLWVLQSRGCSSGEVREFYDGEAQVERGTDRPLSPKDRVFFSRQRLV